MPELLEVDYELVRSVPDDKRYWIADSFDVSEEVFKQDFVYKVVVDYETGNTFGSHETDCVDGIYATPEEAYASATDIEDGGSGHGQYKGWHTPPWVGYFEGLIGVNVLTIKVLDKPTRVK